MEGLFGQLGALDRGDRGAYRYCSATASFLSMKFRVGRTRCGLGGATGKLVCGIRCACVLYSILRVTGHSWTEYTIRMLGTIDIFVEQVKVIEYSIV